MGKGKIENVEFVIRNIHDANVAFQFTMDELAIGLREEPTGVDYTLASQGPAGLPIFWSVSAGNCGSPLVLADGTVVNRVQMDPRTLPIAKSKDLNLTSKGVVATLDFCGAGLTVLHSEGAIAPSKCRNGIPRAQKGLEATLERLGYAVRTNKASQVVGFVPLDPGCPHITLAAQRLDAIRQACHGLTMLDENGKEIGIGEYAKILVENIAKDTKKRSKASKDGKAKAGEAGEAGDSSNEAVDGDAGSLEAAFGKRVIESFVIANGTPPLNAEEVVEFVSAACEFYAAALAEGVIRAEDKAQAV